MIRDPSDGSVRAPRKFEMPQRLKEEDATDVAKERERLRKSREWLEEYYRKRRRNE